MTTLADLFLNSTGRIGRMRFLLGSLGLIFAWAAIDTLSHAPVWLHAFMAAALMYSGLCVLSQRLHDRGRSGWLSVPIMLVFVLAWPHPASTLGWIATATLAVAIVDLAIMPGQKAFNRYGAAPRSRRQIGATPG